VTAWDPSRKLALTWDYTDEGRSDLSVELSEVDGGTRLVLDHVKIGIDPIEYGAGWQARLESMVHYLAGETDREFRARFDELVPLYDDAAVGTSRLGEIDRAAGSVHIERLLPSPVDEVWAALTDPARLSDWLGSVDGAPGPDAKFTLTMLGGAVIPCTVVVCDPPRELRLSLGGDTELGFRLSDVDGKTRLTLHEEKFFGGQDQAAAGWHLYLDNLTASLRGIPFGERPEIGAGHEELTRRYAATG
jgi:uncharacterized protein YndB with AHSA1/START domain